MHIMPRAGKMPNEIYLKWNYENMFETGVARDSEC